MFFDIVLVTLLLGQSLILHGQIVTNEAEGTANTEVVPSFNQTESSLRCAGHKECRAGCGSRADDFECSEDGVCICLNLGGPPRRCRNMEKAEEFSCTQVCKRKVAQICVTDFGDRCCCFVRNMH